MGKSLPETCWADLGDQRNCYCCISLVSILPYLNNFEFTATNKKIISWRNFMSLKSVPNVCTADNNIFFVSVDITSLQNCCSDDHRNVRSVYCIKNSLVQSAMATRPTWRVRSTCKQNKLTRIVPDYVHQITSFFFPFMWRNNHIHSHIHCFVAFSFTVSCKHMNLWSQNCTCW